MGKLLKMALGSRQLPEELEQSLPHESEQFLKHVVPTALSHTWSVDEFDDALKGTFASFKNKETVAISAVVATIGPEPEELISASLMSGESHRAEVLTAFANESADLSLNFISRLLAEEAEQDGCVISDPIIISESLLVGSVVRCLEAVEEGISVDAAGHLTPRFTRVAIFSWTPLKKKKRQPALPNKKTS